MKKDAASQKRIVLLSIPIAWLLTGSYVTVGYLALRSTSLLKNWSTMDSFVLTALLASTTLVLGIARAAQQRLFVSNLDGSAPEADSSLDITLRYVTNTTEQYVLFVVACICAVQVSPEISKFLLPTLGSWFVLARVMFAWGYARRPVSRATGFAATFHPTVALLIFSFVELFRAA